MPKSALNIALYVRFSSEDKLKSAIPKSVRVDNYEDFIFKAIDYYSKHLEKAKSYER